MESSPRSTQGVRSAARTGVVGTVVGAVAFFDGVFIGAPIALLSAASLSPLLVYAVATGAVILLVIACCRWVDWFSGNSKRVEGRLESMRRSRLMRHPVAWIQRGSDRWYALAAAVANPILIGALARLVGGRPIGHRRILLGAVAYAIPYCAMWTIVGFALGDTVRAA